MPKAKRKVYPKNGKRFQVVLIGGSENQQAEFCKALPPIGADVSLTWPSLTRDRSPPGH